MNEVSVVICAYTFDRWEELKAAVSSVRRQTKPPREIIVVIDGNQKLLERASQEISGAFVVPNANAPGLSGGRITGAGLATAPIIAFLDDDAVADERWLEELLTAYTHPNVLGVGGHIEPLWRGPRPAWFPGEFNWVIGCTYDGMQVSGGRIRNPIGANMSVRTDVLRNTGEFVPELGRPSVAEETEFCIRATRLHPGGYWVYQPKARVRHVVPPQRGTWAYFVQRCSLEGTAKAVLTKLAGAEQGLVSERHYVRSVLPRAIAREMGMVLRGRPDGLGRVGAILCGVGVTAWAYLKRRLTLSMQALTH